MNCTVFDIGAPNGNIHYIDLKEMKANHKT